MEHFSLTKKLHTDVLEEKYGIISAQVLYHNESVREAHLIDKNGISRTYALTFFDTRDSWNPEIREINEKIKSGQAIGKTFRDFGYEIRKNVIAVSILKLPPWLKTAFLTENDTAKARLSEFYAKKENESPLIYGIVTEIYSPDFRPPEVNEVDKAQDNPMTKFLEKIGISKDDIWNRIGSDNNWQDLIEKYDQADTLSKIEESALQERIQNYLLEVR